MHSTCNPFFFLFLILRFRLGNYEWEDHRPKTGMWKGTSGGEVFSFTGCDDDQTSADTPVHSQLLAI